MREGVNNRLINGHGNGEMERLKDEEWRKFSPTSTREVESGVFEKRNKN